MPADSTQSLSKAKKILFLMLVKISAAYVVYTIDANRGFNDIKPELDTMRDTNPHSLSLFCQAEDMTLGPYPDSYSNAHYLINHPTLFKFSTFFDDETGYGALIFLQVFATIIDAAVFWLIHYYKKAHEHDIPLFLEDTKAPTCLQGHLKYKPLLLLMASQFALPTYAAIIFYAYWLGALVATNQICESYYFSLTAHNSSVFSNPYPINTNTPFLLELPMKMIELGVFALAQFIGFFIMYCQGSLQSQYTLLPTAATDSPFGLRTNDGDDDESLSAPTNENNTPGSLTIKNGPS